MYNLFTQKNASLWYIIKYNIALNDPPNHLETEPKAERWWSWQSAKETNQSKNQFQISSRPKHIPLKYLHLSPCRRKNSHKSDAASTTFSKEKGNIFNVVSQSYRTQLAELVFDYNPSYTWSSQLIHHPQEVPVANQPTCLRTTWLGKKHKIRLEKHFPHPGPL